MSVILIIRNYWRFLFLVMFKNTITDKDEWHSALVAVKPRALPENLQTNVGPECESPCHILLHWKSCRYTSSRTAGFRGQLLCDWWWSSDVFWVRAMSRASHQVCKHRDGDSQNVELVDSHRSSFLNLHSCLNTEKSLHVMPDLIPWIQSILACDVFSRTYFYFMYICEDMIENIKFCIMYW